MTSHEIMQKFVKWIGTSLTGPKNLTKNIWIATVATASFLLSNVGIYLEDLNRIKKAGLQSIEADAQIKIAKSLEAANKASHMKRSQAIADNEAVAKAKKLIAETSKIEAEANKENAKAHAIISDAKSRQKKVSAAIAVLKEERTKKEQVEINLIEALKLLKEEGGGLYVNVKQLQTFLDRGKSDYNDEETLLDEGENTKS